MKGKEKTNILKSISISTGWFEKMIIWFQTAKIIWKWQLTMMVMFSLTGMQQRDSMPSMSPKKYLDEVVVLLSGAALVCWQSICLSIYSKDVRKRKENPIVWLICVSDLYYIIFSDGMIMKNIIITNIQMISMTQIFIQRKKQVNSLLPRSLIWVIPPPMGYMKPQCERLRYCDW